MRGCSLHERHGHIGNMLRKNAKLAHREQHTCVISAHEFMATVKVRGDAQVHGKRPYTEISPCVPTYTLPLATVGTVNFTARPAASPINWALL